MNTPTRGRGFQSACLFHYIRQRMDDTGSCTFLPSLMAIGQELNCSAFEIHLGLQAMEEQGYQFLIFDMDSPITFFRQEAA